MEHQLNQGAVKDAVKEFKLSEALRETAALASTISAAYQPEELRMNGGNKIIGAPRIQVVLSLAGEAKMTVAGTFGPFDAWLIFELPDGKPAATIPLAGGPFIQHEAMLLMETIWTSIGEKFAKPEAVREAMGLESQ